MEKADEKVRIPRQKRGIETKGRIIQAARELFSRKGFHGTNSKEIAAAAGVSIGTFYSYFEDKKALFLEVLEDHNEGLIRKIFGQGQDGFMQPGDKKKFIDRLIRMGLAAHDLSPQFHREALGMKYSDPGVEAIHSRVEGLVLDRLASLFKSMGDKIRIRDVEAAAAVVYCAFEEVVHSIKIFEPKVAEERLINELSDMISRYLFK
jgi:AcrR family transcriptional regulator